MRATAQGRLATAIAPVFVLIWSTGFIGARYGMPHAEPATFLAMRFGGVLLIMLPMVMAMRIPWPSRATAALIVGLQPILTAILGGLVEEHVTSRQWFGLALGLAGVLLVVLERLTVNGLSTWSLVADSLALVSITIGTLYQKRYVSRFDLRIGSVIQFAAGLALVLPVALLFETRHVEWTVSLIGAVVWSIVALSLGATSLLFLLIRRGAATRVASLMYLTPAVTAVMARILFGDRLTLVMIAGIVVTALGIVVMMQPRAPINPTKPGAV